METTIIPMQLSLSGIDCPPLLLAILFGASLALGLFHWVDRRGYLGYIGHPPLFYASLCVVCTYLLGLTLIPF